jgi:hypothetical protein
MTGCDWCKVPETITVLDGENLCQSCADKWGRGESEHTCSFSSSRLVGGPASHATFHCNVCGEEWDKDVS